MKVFLTCFDALIIQFLQNVACHSAVETRPAIES